MSSSFFGFNIGVRALAASQRALEVAGHNIANINTPGHSRQEAVLETSQPEGLPQLNGSIAAGQLGSGVQVTEIRRLHDNYIERQLNGELQNQGKWETSLSIFEQIEAIFAEPTDNGLRSMMDTYWNSWRDLENSPENYSIRKNLVENSKSLCNLIQSIYQKLQSVRKDLNTEIYGKVESINNYAHQIQELNSLIKKVTINGDNANDLLDQRDVLIRNLSSIANIEIKQSPYNQVDLFIGGTAMVRGESYFPLEAELSAETGFYNLKWEGTDRYLSLGNGQLYSMINFRDSYLPNFMDSLDELASTIISQTNDLHSGGYGLDGTSTGYDFFSGTGASDIDVNSQIYDHIELIAAAADPEQPGDNQIARQILALREQPLLDGNTTNTDSYYNNLIVRMGIEAQQCKREQENSKLLIDKINLRRESVSGISLDEELVNMVKFQHSYNAAARIINTMDQLFETIINDMGAG